MELLLLDLVSKYPVVAGVIAVVGILRLVVKPLMSIVEAVVLETASKKDDEAVAKVKDSGIYKGLIWVVDYLASVKLPK